MWLLGAWLYFLAGFGGSPLFLEVSHQNPSQHLPLQHSSHYQKHSPSSAHPSILSETQEPCVLVENSTWRQPTLGPRKNLIHPCHHTPPNYLQLPNQCFALPCHSFFLFPFPESAGHRNPSAGLLPEQRSGQQDMCQPSPLTSTFPIKAIFPWL